MNEDEILYGASCIAHKVEDRVGIVFRLNRTSYRLEIKKQATTVYQSLLKDYLDRLEVFC